MSVIEDPLKMETRSRARALTRVRPKIDVLQLQRIVAGDVVAKARCFGSGLTSVEEGEQNTGWL